MGDAHNSKTVDDVGKDIDGVNLSPAKVTLGNSAMNKEDNLYDENDGLKNKALGWLLEEIHMTWTHLEKKQDKSATLCEVAQRITYSGKTASEIIVTPSGYTSDSVRSFVTASKHNRLNEALENLAK
ncbi:hypothetical protein Tco_0451279 [Tanacetum coccineum]